MKSHDELLHCLKFCIHADFKAMVDELHREKKAQPTNPAGRIYRLRPFCSRIVFQYALIMRAHSFFFSFFWTSSSFLGLNLMWLNKFAYCRTFPDCFSLSSFVTFHNIDYIICLCAFFVILCPCFLHRNLLYDIPSQCYSSSDDHDVLHGALGLTGILFFVPVTKLFIYRLLLLWFFQAKRVTLTFSVAKLVQAVFCKYQMSYSSDFFQKLFAACTSQ